MDANDVFWFIAVLTSGVATGAMMADFLLVGRFLNWFFSSNNIEMFRKSYPVFLKTKKAGPVFDGIFPIAIVAGIAYLLFLVFNGHTSFTAMGAVAMQWVFLLVFYGTGFAGLEKRLFGGGVINPEDARRFLKMNMPVLAVMAALLMGSFAHFLCMSV